MGKQIGEAGPALATLLSDEVVERLRDSILRGPFAPGDRLREEQLADALGGEILQPECPGVLVIGKRSATPERFPRRPGMAAKRPLRAAGSDRPRR